MRRMLWIALGLGGCGGDEDGPLADLTGSWAGPFLTDAGDFPVTAEFTWDKGAALLSGEVVVEEAPAAPHTYAVRRSEVVQDEAYLELTDVTDGTRGLDATGLVVKGEFSGEATLRYPCGPDICGWQGTFTLLPVEAPTTPAPTTGATP